MTLFEHPFPLLQWGTVIGASLVASLCDLRSRRIPNSLTGPLFIAGVAASAAFGGAAGLLDAAAAGCLLAVPYVLLFVLAGGGAGDAKLMGALGAWLGVVQGAVTLACVCACGVLLALIFACSRNNLGSVLGRISGFGRAALAPLGSATPRSVSFWLPVPDDSQKMPYGVAVLAGTVLSAYLFKIV